MLRRYKKGIAILLLLTFGQEIFLPGTLWALTGGPSQPEVNSFEPVGTNQMVDLATGDFTYNIPLMVVPGPNGSYPINLAYHAGIGMEQEASWVGLGWNINPGAITRNLRGVPDDFSGDEVTQKLNLKNNVTTSLNFGFDQLKKEKKELLGLDENAYVPKWSLKTYFNNYSGVGYTVTPSPIKLLSKTFGGFKLGAFRSALNLSIDSQTGLDVNVSMSLTRKFKLKKWQKYGRGFNAGIGWNTQQGLTSLRFSPKTHYFGGNRRHQFIGGYLSFSTSSYFPSHNFSTGGFNTSVSFLLTKKNKLTKTKKNLNVEGGFILNRIRVNEMTLNSYGTLYMGDVEGLSEEKKDITLQDYNIANDVAISKRSKNMGVPMGTNDIFSITGQGIGGTFQAHRNDIGRFYSTKSTSRNAYAPIGAEFGTGVKETNPSTAVIHVGVDGPTTVGGGWSYSGKMKNGNELIDDLDFQPSSSKNPRYEPVYFKMNGEHTALPADYWDHMNNFDTTAMEIGLKWFEGGIAPTPDFKNRVVGMGGPSGHLDATGAINKERIKKAQNIQFKTKEEIIDHEHYTYNPSHIYGSGDVPGQDAGATIDYEAIGGLSSTDGLSHIHEYEIVQPNGMRYTYGLPAYNKVQRDFVFSNTSASEIPTNMYDEGDLVNYHPDDATLDNDEGIDHYFSENEIPPFTHAHLLTHIASADYVDLTGDGPTEDDLGYYTKFNYTTGIDYKWREPFYKADYIKGFYSNESDDKAFFSYGEKQLQYIHSIETKTHIAIFELGDREDGVGVSEVNQTPSSALGAKQKYLKKIRLYSKKDIEEAYSNALDIDDVVPLQTVHFKYNYELCPGVLNNTGSAPTDYPEHFTSATNTGGKLTLKEVYITYNGNEKGRLSPYQFNYTSNQNYSRLNMDRWGNYQEAASLNEHEINPYTRQNLTETERIENASAWCLSEIDLPSGGTLSVKYEQDDYGYVQDKRAAQMVEILGLTDTETTESPDVGAATVKLSKKKLRLWFKADALEGIPVLERDAVIGDYISGLSHIYFKVFTELKKPESSSEWAKDYVVGYAKINSGGVDYYGADTDENYGYVDLEAEQYKSMGLDIFKTHPFRKAAWQYLRYSRSDLFNNLADMQSTDAIEEFTSTMDLLVDGLQSALTILPVGQYNQYAIWNYCKQYNGDKTSFIRLNSPNKHKYGGGHRVSGIYVSDNWTEGARDFGTEYQYINEDGSTSGVADYEPIIGGEENALKQPKWYNPNDQLINFQHQDLYLETPLMEALYPAPRVVYARVVKNQTGNLPGELPPELSVEDAQVGLTVHEHYTARDFPVIETHSELEHKGYNIPLYIPYVGFLSHNNNGFSQGYSIELNDMSGRQKAVSIYPPGADFENEEPISKTEYIYQTETDNPKKLYNKVEVLEEHGVIKETIMGVQMDFSMYEEENSSYSESVTGEGNLNVSINSTTGLIIPIPTLWPKINHSQFMYRGLSTSKVIRRSGILKRVEVTTDGSMVSTENVYYDGETGEALLTKVTNEWDKPVYNYKYAAHWNYSGMEGAYENYGNTILLEGSGANVRLVKTPLALDFLDNTEFINEGDEITVNDGGVLGGDLKTYYVSQIVDETFFKLEAEDGTNYVPASIVEGKITRSGKRNMQAVKSGSIVALSQDFLSISGNLSPYFLVWNSKVTGADPQEGADEVVAGEAPYFNENTGEEDTYIFDDTKIFMPNVYDCNSMIFMNCFIECFESHYTNEKFIIRDEDSPSNWIEITFTGVSPMDDGYIAPTLVGLTTSYTEQFVDFKIVSEVRDVSGLPTSIVMQHIPSGNLYNANCDLSHGRWTNCEVTNILHADATVFEDNWDYPYADLGDPAVGITGSDNISDIDINEYRYGKKGIWRAKMTYLYQIARKQSGPISKNTRINIDGEYEPWEPYSWIEGASNPKWDWVSEITLYNPYGFPIEERSRLNNADDDLTTDIDESTIYSSQLYGYKNSVVIANSALASYYEIGFTGFEQESADDDVTKSGHIELTPSAGFDVVDNVSHTGQQSLKLLDTETVSFNVEPLTTDPDQLSALSGHNYVISLWVNVEETGAYGELSVAGKTVSTDDSREIVDGWKKLEIAFDMNNVTNTVTYASNGETHIDDLRFGPYDGGMMTYVYDSDNLWLLAELDGLNYATFYNYDEEGNLVQVKKETEKGIVTVQTARSNTVQTP